MFSCVYACVCHNPIHCSISKRHYRGLDTWYENPYARVQTPALSSSDSGRVTQASQDHFSDFAALPRWPGAHITTVI